MSWWYIHTAHDTEMQGNLSSSEEVRRNEMSVPHLIEIYSWQVEGQAGVKREVENDGHCGEDLFSHGVWAPDLLNVPSRLCTPFLTLDPTLRATESAGGPGKHEILLGGLASRHFWYLSWNQTHTDIKCNILYMQYSTKHLLKASLYKADYQHKIFHLSIHKAIGTTHKLIRMRWN